MNLSTESSPKLYRHTVKKEWGLGILAWEGPQRRRYQFQDGRMRTIGAGYYDKMVEVDDAPDNARAIIAELTQGVDAALARDRLAKINPSASNDLLSLEDQIRLFQHEYPGGFIGERWMAEKRGADSKRPLKRFRDPVLEKAKELLSEEALERSVESERADEHMDAIIDMLERTDLVRMKDEVSRLVGMHATEREKILVAISDLAYGSDPLSARFDRLVTTLSPLGTREPSWGLATIFGALAQPKQHIAVKPTMFRKQAQWAMPTLKHRNNPHGRLYQQYLGMAQLVDRSLFRHGLEPQDLVDVYDFMSVTLRTSAKAALEALPPAKASELLS